MIGAEVALCQDLRGHLSKNRFRFRQSGTCSAFCIPIFAEGENWEPEERRFQAVAGAKEMVFERPRNSCYFT